MVTAGPDALVTDRSDWPYNSAVGQGTAWDTKWDIYGNDNLITPDRIHGGKIATGTIQKHFVTSGLKSFKVIGPSSGEMAPHFGWAATSSPTSPDQPRQASSARIPRRS